ncbi:MAG: ABC transporter substrate-binding protein [Nitrospinota bacterium]
MRKGSWTVLALIVVFVVWAAAPVAVAEKPRRGGVLNWLDYADPRSLDIHAESPLAVQQALAGVYSGLLQYSPQDPSKIIPDLATSYDVSDGGTVYTFHLRKGVKWHDGKPFTAADVKATFDRVLDPKFRSPRCGSTLLKPIVKSVQVVDDYTVKFTLKFPAGTFIPSVASAWCRIAAKHILEKYGNLRTAKTAIGTGPFKLKRYVRRSVIEWVRNKDYFIKGLPYLDGVKQFILVGRTTQLAAAKAGKVGLWLTWPPLPKSLAQEIKKARPEEVDIYQWSINTVYEVYLNIDKPPFNIPDMRRAVHLAIDRQEIIDKVFEGSGVPCAILDPKLFGDFALPMEEVMKTPGCRQPKDKDIAEARRLVRKHYPNGLDVEIATRAVANYVDRTQLLIQHLRRIGIRGKLKTYESAVGFRQWGKRNFTIIGSQDTAMIIPDPHGAFALLWHSKGGRNYPRWKSARVDALVGKAMRETDRAKRVKMYHELQRILLREPLPTITVAWMEGWFFKDRRVKNYRPSCTVYDNNTFQNVWLSK